MINDSRLATHALAYARLGLEVFPCVPNAKNPATARGFYDATANEDMIEEYWKREPKFNVAIRTGSGSDFNKTLVVWDVDPRNGGTETFSKLLEVHGPLPITATVITGRGDGGFHYYFWCPQNVTLGSKLGQGIDIKWRGGYVIAPPSIHPESSLPYQWHPSADLLAGAVIAPLPQWSIEMFPMDTPLPARPTGGVSESQVPIDNETYRDLRSALFSLRADDYGLWVRMGLALRELGDVGRGLWMEWSSQSEKFDPREAARKWDSFK